MKKALTRAENEQKRDRLEKALLKAQERAGHSEDPNLLLIIYEENDGEWTDEDGRRSD